MEFDISANSHVLHSTGETGYATVSSSLFGGILVNKDANSTSAFSASLVDLNLTLLRWPGGSLAENGQVRVESNGESRVFVSGADPLQWAAAAESSASNYFYDLSYPDLINPQALASNPDIVGLSGALRMACQNNIGIEIIIPTVRYSGFGMELSDADQRALVERFSSDVATFLDELLVQRKYGELPDEVVIDIGNENLVWTIKYDGETLRPEQKYNPSAVQEAMEAYFRLLEVALELVKDLEESHPGLDIKIAVQLPYMNNQVAASDDPQDVFIQLLGELPIDLLAEIDILRFHALTLDLSDASNFENWFSDEIARASKVINGARLAVGGLEPVEVAVSAWSVDGRDVQAESPLDTSLAAAGAAVAAVASFAEIGVDFAAAWGFAIPYMPQVQLSRLDEQTDRMVYSPVAEVIRQMSESLPGTQLLTPRHLMDSGRVAPANIQVFGNDSTLVIFVSANDIQDGDSDDIGSAGEDIIINIADLGGEIGYAWVETVNVADGSEGEAVVWNPKTDDANRADLGEVWISFDGNQLKIHLTDDYQVARIIVARADPGNSPLYLMGDSRLGNGTRSDRLNGGAGGDTLLGLSGSDTLIGNSGDDVLDGGDGFDRIFGGSGNDTIVGGYGDDTIAGEAGDDSLFGGGGADSILGGLGRDALDGGNGSDTLIGGDGDDVYYADTIDLIIEEGNAGNDRVETNVSYTLGLNIEDLTLIGIDSVNGTGNGLNNVLIGNLGANCLTGGTGNDTLNGGTGQDTLVGGAGADSFVFDTALGSANADIIADFSPTDDVFRLKQAVFTGLPLGTLPPTAFTANTSGVATHSAHRIIYETDTGLLFFDADGSGPADAVRFAAIQPNLVLSNSDFFLF